eukprot:3797500-Rhodomonas_salina.1
MRSVTSHLIQGHVTPYPDPWSRHRGAAHDHAHYSCDQSLHTLSSVTSQHIQVTSHHILILGSGYAVTQP